MRRALFITAMLIASAASAQQTLEIDAWTGHAFVLLPKSPKAQQYGYRSFVPALPYAQWLGKTLTVTNVEQGAPAIVTFRASDGATVRAEAYNGTVHDLALASDLESAKKRWSGKALWLRVDDILTYDADGDKFRSIRLGKGARVVVKDVVGSSLDYEPAEFLLVADDGRSGFLDVQLSGTNVSKGMRGTDTFEQLFSERAP